MFGFGLDISSSATSAPSSMADSTVGLTFLSELDALEDKTVISSDLKKATVVNSEFDVLRFITQDIERALGVWLILVMMTLFLCLKCFGNYRFNIIICCLLN